MRRFASAFVALGTAALIAGGSGPSASQEVSFAGKTARMVINFGVGSSAEASHRILLPFIAKHLPGKPNLILEEKVGGGGVAGGAYVLNQAAPDGMTAGILVILVPMWATGSQLPFDLTKFVSIGGAGVGWVALSTSDSGIDSVSKLTSTKLIVAGTTPTAPDVLSMRLFLSALGKDVQFIPGYKGQLEMLQALRAKEVNLIPQSTPIFTERRAGYKREGLVVPLFESGLPDATGADKPTAGLGLPIADDLWRKLAPQTVGGPEHRLYQALQKTRPLAFYYVLPPGTDPKFQKAWSDAIKAAYADPEYRAVLEKAEAPVPITLDAAAARSFLEELGRELSDPALRATMERFRN